MWLSLDDAVGLYDAIAGLPEESSPEALTASLGRVLPLGAPTALCLMGHPIQRGPESLTAALQGEGCRRCPEQWRGAGDREAVCGLDARWSRIPIETERRRVGYFILGAHGDLDDASSRRLRLVGRTLVRAMEREPPSPWQGAVSAEERLSFERYLLKAQRMESMGRLADAVAHDLNNVLQAIATCTEVALVDLAADHVARIELESMTEATTRAATLVRRLLVFGRHEEMALEPLDVNALIHQVQPLLQHAVEAPREVRLELAESLPVVEADPIRIEQAIVQLVMNARDALPGAGVIRLSTRQHSFDTAFCERHAWARPGSYVEILVGESRLEDSEAGGGAAWSDVLTSASPEDGADLGLMPIVVIARQHQGHLFVEPVAGQGDTARLFLRAASPSPDGAPVPDGPRASTRTAATVLLGEDDELVRRVARRLLEGAGYRVYEAGDGEAAIRVFLDHEGEIDLLLLDLGMPRLGGWEVSETLRAKRPDLPVVFFSGRSHPELQRRIRDAGRCLLRKPFRAEELLDAVERAVSFPREPS